MIASAGRCSAKPIGGAVITFRLRLAVAASRRQEVTAVLHSLLGPIRAQQGCAATACLSDVAEGDELTFVEEVLGAAARTENGDAVTRDRAR
jgi:hypothetical protein